MPIGVIGGSANDSWIKAWAFVTVTAGSPAVTEHTNVAGITDNGIGDFTLTWDVDFATATYVIAGTGFNAGGQINITPVTEAVGSMRYTTVNSADGVSDVNHHILAVGRQ